MVAFDSSSNDLKFIAGPDNLAAIKGSKQIPITANAPGEHSFNFQLFSKDGTAIASDTFSFRFQPGTIEDPILSFSEDASKDAFVKVLVSDSRTLTVDQLWIEGDVTEKYKSKWLDINQLDEVFIEMTPGQGLKNFKMKTREIYGAQSAVVDKSILVDSVSPLNCNVDLASDTVAAPFAYLRLNADDDQQMKYTVIGDIAAFKGDQLFSSGEKIYVELSPGEGEKTIVITLSDLADNVCLFETHTITLDSTHNPIGISITGNPIYTFNDQIELNFRIDTFETEAYQIQVSGGLEDSLNLESWIPYQEKMNVTLASKEGNRFVYMKILENGSESKKVYDNVYLNPTMRMTSGSPYKIHLPNIIETQTITITGCTESLVDILYNAAIDCTPNAPKATATLYFNDGTNLVLEEDF